jgi:quercetin dioxygenase-like cupin family protein
MGDGPAATISSVRPANRAGRWGAHGLRGLRARPAMGWQHRAMGMRANGSRVTDSIMDDHDAVILDGLGSLELDQSQPAIYDRPIGVRLLHHDPTSGAEHYLIRYPAGLQARTHRHSAAHTIVVLEGRLQANGQDIGPGPYCHFPAGEPMHHAPAGDGDCLFETIFHGPFDVQPED